MEITNYDLEMTVIKTKFCHNCGYNHNYINNDGLECVCHSQMTMHGDTFYRLQMFLV